MMPKKKKILLLVIILVAVLAIAGGVVVVLLAIKAQNNNNGDLTEMEETAADFKVPYDHVIGAWESQAKGGSCFTFGEGGVAYWLHECWNYKENFYYGEVNPVSGASQGEKALKAAGKDLENVKQMLQIDEDITKDDVFYVRMAIGTSKIGDEYKIYDLSEKRLSLIFVRHENSNDAYGYLIDTGDMFVFKKNNEAKVPSRKTEEPATAVQ